jgi:RNA polymerase sigma factor (sigma-70 family)
MASCSSFKVFRQVDRLFNLGAVGALTDEQLLDGFVSHRDPAAEAAFEELVIRHGPLVFRVCRSVLHDSNDAEDAFQAVFLILAHRAKSIRRRGSVASWLFGVAHRVASRSRSEAARRRAHHVRIAELTQESYMPTQEGDESKTIHDEINRLPERLRSVVTLCYLEGSTYEAAAQQLGLSEGTVRGRLARARERLRLRLNARGVTVPAGLMAAGIAGCVHATIPAALAHSTVQIALGFLEGETACVLARGVLNSMLLKQLKVAMVLVLLGIGGRYYAWNAVAGFVDEKAQADRGQVDGKVPAPAPASTPKPQATKPAVLYRLSGTVRVEGTDAPIAGAKLQIQTGDHFDFQGPVTRHIESGADGQFAVDLPTGQVQVHLAEPPGGYYWIPNRSVLYESLFVGPDQPAIHREYRVRQGTTWEFEFTRGADRKPAPGFVSGRNARLGESLEAQADATGRMRLALPTDSREVTFSVRESSPSSSSLETGELMLRLKRDSEFRPDLVREISLQEHADRAFRLIDANQMSAVLSGSPQIEPVIENGRLIIRVAMPDRDSRDLGAVTGQVLDDKDCPISGVLVGLAANQYRVSNELRHQSTTNRDGWYRLRDIPRRGIDGKPLKFPIVAAKNGYAGFVAPPVALDEAAIGKFQVVDPIRLKPGVTVSGIVVDHCGQPVAGAWVRSDKPVPHIGLSENLQTARTDENGRFTLSNLRPGMTRLITYNGRTFYHYQHVRVGSTPSVLVRLPEDGYRQDTPRQGLARAEPLRPGQAAVEWQVGPWSDGRSHTLAADRGKPIVLYFWGTDFRQSVEALPALGKLAAAFEPRGVVFRMIHRPDGDEKLAIKEARRVLRLTKAPPTFALDQVRVERHSRGMTGQDYGIIDYPVLVLIDRAGKIAFRSDMTAGDKNLAGVFIRILTDPQAMTEEKSQQLVERAIGDEIESVLKGIQ